MIDTAMAGVILMAAASALLLLMALGITYLDQA